MSEPRDSPTCPDCERPLELSRKCPDCGAWFRLSLAQQRFFETNNLRLPKRCDRCRADRRRSSENPEANARLELEANSGQPFRR
jgi:hypothetical protein